MRKSTPFIVTVFLLLETFVASAQYTFGEVPNTMGLEQLEGAQSVAIGDFDNDGNEDLFACFLNKKPQLWKNMGGSSFKEVTLHTGLIFHENANSITAIWGDIDNDGDLDLYVGNTKYPDMLFRNNGDETFTEISQQAGIFQVGQVQSVNMADVNNDGWLDIYVSNSLQENVLYLNNKNGTFSNNTLQSGALDSGRAMGSIFFDYDKDGDADLYLVHDGFEPNLLYQNDGTGHFKEVGATAGVNTASFGMGVDIGDVNNDTWPDIYVTNLGPNFLLMNKGDGTFFNISGITLTDDFGMGWGCTIFDFDNNGWQDIYVANDSHFSPHPNVLYRNLGKLIFTKAETTGPVCNLMASYGTACFDFNLDGHTDLAVANRVVPEYLQLFKNTDQSDHWIGFKLIGVQSNRQAVGAKIRITDGKGILHYDELTAGNGWISQNSNLFHFGLGDATTIKKMTVFWPSGLQQNIDPLDIGKYYTIVEGQQPANGISFGATSPTKAPFYADEPDIKVFPNPNGGQFFIKIESQPSDSAHFIKIANPLGQPVFQKIIENPEGSEQIISVDLENVTGAQMLLVEVFNKKTTLKKWVAIR